VTKRRLGGQNTWEFGNKAVGFSNKKEILVAKLGDWATTKRIWATKQGVAATDLGVRPTQLGTWLSQLESGFLRCSQILRQKIHNCHNWLIMVMLQMWLWINTYENTIFSGMNIHKSQLFWCEQKRGTIGFDTVPCDSVVFLDLLNPPKQGCSLAKRSPPFQMAYSWSRKSRSSVMVKSPFQEPIDWRYLPYIRP